MLSQFAYCQTPNSIPSSGNVGIGTTNPTSKLQVKGSVRIDSSLTVKKSMVVQKNTQLNGTLKVSSTFSLPNLVDTSYSSNTVLMLNENGDVVNGGTLRDQVYTVETPTYPGNNCPTDMNGNVLYSSPYWEHENQGMFLIDEACTYSPRLGIGVKPDAKVHIRAKESDGITPFLVDYKLMNGAGIKKLLQLDTSGLLHTNKIIIDGFSTYVPSLGIGVKPEAEVHIRTKEIWDVSPFLVDLIKLNGDTTKLLQLDTSGTLHAREIIIDAQEWADFVFSKNYQLPDLKQVETFINKNGHLQGVLSATEVKKKGLNIVSNSKVMLQKIEELTLYTIEQEKKLNAQKDIIKQLTNKLDNLERRLIQLTDKFEE